MYSAVKKKTCMMDYPTKFFHLREKFNSLKSSDLFWYRDMDGETDDLLREIEEGKRELRDNAAYEFPPLAIQQVSFSCYLAELWISEFPQDRLSLDETKDLVHIFLKNEKDVFLQMLTDCYLHRAYAERIWLKLHNLHQLLKEYFPLMHFGGKGAETLCEKSENPILTVDFIHTTHRKLCEGLMENEHLGKFRERMVAPAHAMGFAFAHPRVIGKKLDRLLLFINEKFQGCTSLEESLVVCALFFSEFLLIHPYINGNGRTARVLLSWMLKSQTFIPISIALSRDDTRSIYLRVLEARNQGEAPYYVARFVLECLWSNIRQVRSYLDMY